ncbi:MAG TPA: tetratricopeptide repeat protein [Usitatibacter sp.]|nr:tetratricopeptide repeat protein [Usitatibacter sp.]
MPAHVKHESIAAACERAVLNARGGDPRLGFRISTEAYRKAKAEGGPAAVLTALNAVAICQASNGMHINALGTAMDAYRLAVELQEGRGRVHAMLSFAFAAIDIFRVPGPEFLEIIRRCRDEAAALRDASLQARAENTLGAAHMIAGDFAAARKAYQRALALAPATHGSTPESLVLGNLANVGVRMTEAAARDKRGELAAEARRLVEAALECAVADKAVGAELRAHANGGWLLALEGRHEEALDWLGRALAIARRCKHHTHVAVVNKQIGDALMALGRHAEAAEAYEAAFAVASEIRPDRVLQDVCNRRADALHRMGDAAGAARAFARAAEESVLYDRERSHARATLRRFLREIGSL